ncbi:DNA-directed RNA polymerase III subunit RPC7 [Aplochiton taeniatus]
MGGRGRGIAAFSFNVESLGITRGCMPEARVGPNPLFPNVEFKPAPLKVGEDEDYMLGLKQEMRGAMKLLPHFIQPLARRRDVERYKETYLCQKVADKEWTPDWHLFPKELMPQTKKAKVKQGTKKKPKIVSTKGKADVLNKLEADDYIASYFEDGDDFDAGSDDNMDEATY